MSLSNALSNAVSGIVAASRGTEVVATNLANALTPGFARRELQLSSRPHVAGGGGVHVDGVTRQVRNSVLAQSRLATAETARAGTLVDFHKALSDAYGVPGQSGALSTLVAEFDAALTTAVGRPESEANLSRVATTAQALARSYNALGEQVQDARTAADRAIASDIAALNSGLARVSELNRQITVQLASGDDATALQDSRQRIIASLSEIVPIQELPRDGGRVALFTPTGAVLLDGFAPARFDFSPAGRLTAQMEVGTPPVGLVAMNGKDLSSGQMNMLEGGRLSANFRIRDEDAPAAQMRLDAAALDLHDRLADPSVDATLGGAPGLFTDDGGVASLASQRGLSQRLTVNPAVLPDRGGALWRLRDGLGAATTGPVGDSSLLNRMGRALGDQRMPASAGVTAELRTAAGFAADLSSLAAAGRLGAETTLSAASAQSGTYDAMVRQDGVDSDHEMETLLALERAYASNAKVLQAVDDMIQTILRLT